jgi:uncharacterized protein YndB with AHSA1/START domain
MAKKIALGLGAAIALLAVVVALQPATFAIERTVSIAAPPAVIYPHIASVRAMDVWSPWSKLDPDLAIHYEGPESGVGAQSVWEGPQMGSGSVTVTSVAPEREVEMRLRMQGPMTVDNRVLFTLAPSAQSTDVTWRMEGANGFAGKAMSLVFDSDRMVGGEFEKGLAALKTLAEAEAQRRTAQ